MTSGTLTATDLAAIKAVSVEANSAVVTRLGTIDTQLSEQNRLLNGTSKDDPGLKIITDRLWQDYLDRMRIRGIVIGAIVTTLLGGLVAAIVLLIRMKP